MATVGLGVGNLFICLFVPSKRPNHCPCHLAEKFSWTRRQNSSHPIPPVGFSTEFLRVTPLISCVSRLATNRKRLLRGQVVFSRGCTFAATRSGRNRSTIRPRLQTTSLALALGRDRCRSQASSGVRPPRFWCGRTALYQKPSALFAIARRPLLASDRACVSACQTTARCARSARGNPCRCAGSALG